MEVDPERLERERCGEIALRAPLLVEARRREANERENMLAESEDALGLSLANDGGAGEGSEAADEDVSYPCE